MIRNILILPFLFFLIGCSSSPSTESPEPDAGNSLDMPDGIQTFKYRGFYADEQPNGIYNPERGFRIGTSIDAQGHNYPYDWEGKTTLTSQLLERTEKWAADSVSLTTSYFYLTRYLDKDLDERAFSAVSDYLKAVRELGKKVLLRFAYEISYEEAKKDGPTEERILRHIDQLKSLLKVNKDVIYVVQAGFIGCWGEWHDSHNQLEKDDKVAANILSHIVDMTPEDRYVQVRYPGYKELLKNDPKRYNRIGIHDDFIILDGVTGGAEEMYDGGKWFPYIVEQSYDLPVDGEMPPFADWNKPLDGNKMARQLFLEHFASLSCINAYDESMGLWKKTVMDKELLNENHMPISSCYFKNKNGVVVNRSCFDYIRDHLGYRFELQDIEIQKKDNQHFSASLKMINRGFARLCNNRAVYFVLVSEDGNVFEFTTESDLSNFYPHARNDASYTPLVHTVKGEIQIDKLPKGSYKLGCWMPDESTKLHYLSRYAVRCANGGNVVWWNSSDKRYGINLLDDVTINIK